MEKICFFCKKKFYKKDYQRYGYTDRSWDIRKFCSDKCQKDFTKNKNKKKYTLKKCEHNTIIKKLNKRIKGEIIKNQNLIFDTNPDIIKDDKYIEMELLGSYTKFKKKYSLLPKGKKYILYIGVSKKIKKLFDEIHFLENL